MGILRESETLSACLTVCLPVNEWHLHDGCCEGVRNAGPACALATMDADRRGPTALERLVLCRFFSRSITVRALQRWHLLHLFHCSARRPVHP